MANKKSKRFFAIRAGLDSQDRVAVQKAVELVKVVELDDKVAGALLSARSNPDPRLQMLTELPSQILMLHLPRIKFLGRLGTATGWAS